MWLRKFGSASNPHKTEMLVTGIANLSLLQTVIDYKYMRYSTKVFQSHCTAVLLPEPKLLEEFRCLQ